MPASSVLDAPRPGAAARAALTLVCLAIPGLVTGPATVRAQPTEPPTSRWPDSRDRTLRAHPVSEPITVDGRLDEAAWAAATVASGFVQEEPFDGEPAREGTEVRVLFDEEAVYIGALLRDSDPSRIAHQLTRRDETGRAAGYLEFSFDTNFDRSTGYTFRVTAAGVVRDEYNYADTRSDRAWDAIWDAAVEHGPEGWTAGRCSPARASTSS